jgi:hypothetical protein
MKLIATFFLSFTFFIATAQTGDTVLDKRLTAYMQLSKNLNVDKLMIYMYPRIFELATRKQLADALKTAYNSPDFTITIDSMSINNIDPIQKFAKGSYTLFDYFVRLKFKMLGDKTAEEATTMFEGFQKTFGNENVTLNKGTNTIGIKQEKQALAIKDNYSAGKWTFLGVEKNPMIKKIIPAAIVAKYKL